MVEPEVRRASDPRVARKLHFAIKKTCEQKQAPICERIFRALAIDKVQITRSRLEMQLKNSVHDGVILESNSSAQRGKSSNGEVKASYRVPSLENFYENYEDDGHDWYCWVCHREGEVFLCSRCPRVIHKKCAEVTVEDISEDFVCYCCKDLESTKQYGKKELQELATMLGFTVERMKSKCEELWTSPTEEEEPTFKLFIYKDTNLIELEKKVRRREFDSLAKFHYEIEWLFHNAVIFYGGENKITNLARMVVLDGQNELSQIDICSECYIRSNERMHDWFCLPCKPPHRIVYAKLGSDPPWPAKLLRENEDNTMSDVRFFGAPYQRAWIPIRNIWSMEDKPANKKRSKALVQSENELKLYLRLLAKARKQDKNTISNSDDTATEEEIDDEDDESFTRVQKKRHKYVEEDDDDEEIADEEEEEEMEDDDDDNDSVTEYKSAKRKKKKDKNKSKEGKNKRDRGIGDQKVKPRKLKAEKKFRELQEAKLLEYKKRQQRIKATTREVKVSLNRADINDNISSHDDSADMQLAKQIKMTDDYKMIEKLQERVRQLEKSLDQVKNEYENAQAELESTRVDLAAEKQKSKRLQEQLDKGQEMSIEKLKNDMQLKKQDDLDAAVEEERKRNEMEFQVRLNEALVDERQLAEARVQEAVEKERAQLEGKAKSISQRDREEMQRNLELYKSQAEIKHNHAMEETVRKLKIEAEEMTKRALQENMRRIQMDTERMVAAAKKKSWCSNCTKEAFYHCCWNTNYCSIDCQRIHWTSHRYQCTREMMSTCRSCQQRQNFTSNLAGQVPPK